MKKSRAAYLREWTASHLAQGLCRRCNEPAAPGRTSCPRHVKEHQARYYERQGRRPVEASYIITKDMLLHDLQSVAKRLGWRRITWTTYRNEGSFYPTTKLLKRIGLSWSALCVEAGLLPTRPGCKGIDQRPCTRCGKVCNYYGKGTIWCKNCRRTVRRRKNEAVADWSITTTVQER